MDEKNKAQAALLKKALSAFEAAGELPDDALNAISGGAVLNRVFFMAKCHLCGWQSAPFDNAGERDVEAIAIDHIVTHGSCPGQFQVFRLDSGKFQLTPENPAFPERAGFFLLRAPLTRW